jgi:peroxin-2
MAVHERVMRCGRLDANEMDNELMNMLQDKFTEIFKYIPTTTTLVMNFKPEIKAFIRFILWKWSIGSENGYTFGQEMMSLKYVDSQGHLITGKHKYLLLIFTVFFDWINERFEDILNKFIPRLRSDKIFGIVKLIFQSANLINFCMFLIRGRYPSLRERALGLDVIPTKPQTLRQISHDYMNREIIWYGFSEFLFFVLPLMNVQLIRNWFKRNLQFLLPDKSSYAQSVQRNMCSLCEDLPTQPQIANCGHVYCYYCIAANIKADANFPCSVCSQKAHPFCHWKVTNY